MHQSAVDDRVVPDDLARALLRVGRALKTHTPSDPTVASVRTLDHAVLAHLDLHGESRSGDLAEHLTAAPSVISRRLAALEHDGHIERVPSADDGRVVLIRLTGAGAASLAEARTAYLAYLSELLSGWDDERLRVATEVFNDLADLVHARAAR